MTKPQIFGNLILMQSGTESTAKQAIDAALRADWKRAIELNLQILERDSQDVDAKIRLGKAYLQTKEYTKAKKLYEKVLKEDPVNKIALKNLVLAKERKCEKTNHSSINAAALIKEPGTSVETTINIKALRVTASNFALSEKLSLKKSHNTVSVFKESTYIGDIDDANLIKRLLSALSNGNNIIATFIKGQEKQITILLKSDSPIFRTPKQDIRPYIKKGTIDEPELELVEAEEGEPAETTQQEPIESDEED